MLMRTDPFRELDRLTQALGGNARPTVMQMDAWREGEQFIVEFDLPGVSADAIVLEVEHNVLTVRAERPTRTGNHSTRSQDTGSQDAADRDAGGREWIAAERARGVFTRQLILGDNLDTERIAASYDAGVLRLQIPVAEKSKPRKITIHSSESLTTEDERQLLNA